MRELVHFEADRINLALDAEPVPFAAVEVVMRFEDTKSGFADVVSASVRFAVDHQDTIETVRQKAMDQAFETLRQATNSVASHTLSDISGIRNDHPD